jgi:hypothetical protein
VTLAPESHRCGMPERIKDLAGHDCIVLHENEGDFALWRFGDAAAHARYECAAACRATTGTL